MLKSKNYNNNHSELLGVIKPLGFSSEMTDYLLNKDDYRDIFYEYFNAKRVDFNYFNEFNSLIHRVLISVNLKDVDLFLNKAKDYLMVFDSNLIIENKKLKLIFKKINLLNLLNLEFNYQISYFLYSKKESNNYEYFFNVARDCLINNCFLIREILKLNGFSIFNMSLNSVNQTQKATLANEGKIRGADEAIEFLKKYLSQRNIIDSKQILIDLCKKAVSETIKLYVIKHNIDLERKFINKALNRWLANEFYDFTNAKGIKVNNNVVPLIYRLRSCV